MTSVDSASSENMHNQSPPAILSSDNALKAASLATLLDSWLNDTSGYDEETWPVIRDALDRDRLSSRRLFGG